MRWFLRQEERLPQPDVRQTDERLPVVVGTVLWAVLAVAAFVWHDDLAERDRGWWAWCAVAGAALGLLGLRTLQRRRERDPDDDDRPDGDS